MVSTRMSYVARWLLACALLALASAAFAQGSVVRLDIWYVDAGNRNIFRINPLTGDVLNSFPVPDAVADPQGLAVSGVVGGGSNLWLLDAAPGGRVHRLNPLTGGMLSDLPKPSIDSVGLGAACIVPVNVEEVFVAANDPADPGALYWVEPVRGAILNRCSLGVPFPRILDATAFALGNNGTGVCFLIDLPPFGVGGGTQLKCVNKITCETLLTRDFPWDGWGLGNKTFGHIGAAGTWLFASDRGANVLHVLRATDGDEIFTIPLAPGVSGADVRGVGGDSTCVCAQPPNAPSHLVATRVHGTSALLAWTDNSSDETAFKIERAPTAGGPWINVGSVLADVTVFEDTTLSPQMDYYFRVYAETGQGCSSAPTTALLVHTTPVELQFFTVE